MINVPIFQELVDIAGFIYTPSPKKKKSKNFFFLFV